MWYRDPRHPELGYMYMPDSEAAAGALPPGMEAVQRGGPLSAERIAELYDVPPTIINSVPAEAAREFEQLLQIGATAADAPFLAGEVESAFGVLPLIECGQPSCPNYLSRDMGEGTCPAEHVRLVAGDRTRALASTAPKSELDARLAEGRCYWCGTGMRTSDPYELFDTESCGRAWRLHTQADLEQGGKTLRLDTIGYAGQDARTVTPDPDDTYPRWLGTPRRDLGLIRPPEEPIAWDDGAEPQRGAGSSVRGFVRRVAETSSWRAVREAFIGDSRRLRYPIRDVPPLDARYDYQVVQTEDRRMNGGRISSVPTVYNIQPNRLDPEGSILPCLDQVSDYVARRNDGPLGIGTSWIPGQPALRQISEGPHGGTTSWPVREVQRAQAQGYSLALPPGVDQNAIWSFVAAYQGGPGPAYRRCPRCQRSEMPACHEAQYPEIISERGGGVEVQLRLATHVVCNGCLMPYPGPILIPMWREEVGGISMAVASPGWLSQQHITREAFETLPGDALSRVWGTLYRAASQGSTGGWRCVIPGCGMPVHDWLVQCAPMQAWGWLITPRDHQPLLVGTCIAHWSGLATEIMADRGLRHRVQLTLDADTSSGRLIVA